MIWIARGWHISGLNLGCAQNKCKCVEFLVCWCVLPEATYKYYSKFVYVAYTYFFTFGSTEHPFAMTCSLSLSRCGAHQLWAYRKLLLLLSFYAFVGRRRVGRVVIMVGQDAY